MPGCLGLFPDSSVAIWPLLIALALFPANSTLGNWRTALTCAAGHVVGTGVSEGIVAYRVAHGALPAADRFLLDVGPSYAVVAAIAAALLFGGWLARAAAALDLLLLVVVGQIFQGLSQLEVAAVGHLTAPITGALVASVLVWRRASNRMQMSGLRFSNLPANIPATAAKLNTTRASFPGVPAASRSPGQLHRLEFRGLLDFPVKAD